MQLLQTEQLGQDADVLDLLPPDRAARALAVAQSAAAEAVLRATTQIADAARAMAGVVQDGGRLIYAAAGSSAMMAMSDALELAGTFGIPTSQIEILVAGGAPTGKELPGAAEDETPALASAITRKDILIAVSASGRTPYTVAAAQAARDSGAVVIGIANNAGTPLLSIADHPILLPTPPELLAGSTRLGAATAQKIALNSLSTLMAIRLGHVHDGMMVNLRTDNTKLRARAVAMVTDIARVPAETAKVALMAARGHVKPAVLIAAGGLSPDDAQELLNEKNGNLRAAMARL